MYCSTEAPAAAVRGVLDFPPRSLGGWQFEVMAAAAPAPLQLDGGGGGGSVAGCSGRPTSAQRICSKKSAMAMKDMKALGRSDLNTATWRGRGEHEHNGDAKEEFEVKLCVARRMVHVNGHALLLSLLTLSMPSFAHALIEQRHLKSSCASLSSSTTEGGLKCQTDAEPKRAATTTPSVVRIVALPQTDRSDVVVVVVFVAAARQLQLDENPHSPPCQRCYTGPRLRHHGVHPLSIGHDFPLPRHTCAACLCP